jgi:hypothetical protein
VLCEQFPPPAALASFRTFVATLVFLAAFPIYISLGIDARLPKRVFMPLVLFHPWALLALGMPLPLFVSWDQMPWALSWAQLALGGLAWVMARRLLVYDEGPGSGFELRNTFGFALANLLVILPGFLIYVLVSASLGLSHMTAGFMSLRPSGLYTEERVYTKADRQVHLIATVHAADEAFYTGLFDEIPVDGTLVLEEGVTDDGQLLEARLSYKKFSDALELVEQRPELLATEHERSSGDVDISDLSPKTVAALNLLGRVFEAEDRVAMLGAYREFTQLFANGDAFTVFWRDIVHVRNDHLLERMDAEGEGYQRVVLPWGAAHMPGLQLALQERGYRQTATHERTAIHFGGD